MPARRVPAGLKIKPEHRDLRIADPAKDAQLAGLGIDWSTVPEVLDEAGRAEWQRLAQVFAEDATRFREGDRAAVTAYCLFWSSFLRSAEDVARNGPVVEGRSDKDRGRRVKNPATVSMRESGTQLRYWCRELALTPDSRGRTGITDADPTRDDTDNPFAG
ncbi:MAG TPA: phage terminase small subunit P27 family [Pseudonocardiaceae bacterium]|nr:phage terminase small subunit P27 family [Pseudonocardiaceae bacterium]